jgi:iron complex transport system substrate-binding protein
VRPALRTIVLSLTAAAIIGGGGLVAAAPLGPGIGRGVPQRIMSTNVCTDLLLLELAPKSRIASVTFLAPEAARALFPGAADGIALNHNSAEDVVNVRPDLILDSGLSSPLVRTLARQVGARVVDVKDANSFQDIREILRQVGAEVGARARAQALIARMDATLAELAAHPPKRRLRVVAWSGGSAVPGKGSLTDAIITAAGAENIAARPGPSESSFGVEELLMADPDALLFGGATLGQPSLLNDEGQHRAVRKLYAGRWIAYSDIAHTCGLPQSADSAVALRRALDALPDRRPAR